eukprot:3233346-Alexandrium_andersonii.AAC.1
MGLHLEVWSLDVSVSPLLDLARDDDVVASLETATAGGFFHVMVAGPPVSYTHLRAHETSAHL